MLHSLVLSAPLRNAKIRASLSETSRDCGGGVKNCATQAAEGVHVLLLANLFHEIFSLPLCS